MGHQDHGHDGAGNLKVAFLLNLGFTAFEIGGGLWTNSVAILSDAVHDAGDCFSLGLAWFLERVSRRRADAKFTYGYRRFSSLGALFTAVILTAGLGYVAWEAIERLRNPQPVHAAGVMFIAVIGVLANGAAAWRLRGANSLNEKMAGWHLLEDTLGWLAVLVSGGAMALGAWYILDPLLALAIACFVLWNVARNLRKVAMIFLQASPPDFNMEDFERKLRALPKVLGSHHTHTWTMDGEAHVLSTHVVLAPDSDRTDVMRVKQSIHDLLARHRFEHVTIEVELDGEQCASGHEPTCSLQE